METDAFFQIAKEVRYVALYLDGQLTLRERPGLINASVSESDKYEELIVNPGVLTLVRLYTTVMFGLQEGRRVQQSDSGARHLGRSTEGTGTRPI